MQEHEINDYDTTTQTAHGLDKDHQPITHELKYLGSQMKQSVIAGIKHSLGSLSALLLNLPDGYYLAITTYQNKRGDTKKYKPGIGIDMGIKTTITTSDGKKYKVQIEESERIKKCQRLIARSKKGLQPAGAGTSNRCKAVKLLRKAYQRLTSRKKDRANKIVHELLEHGHIYMQDENLSGWHKGLFSRTVQHSILGLIKAKLLKSERVIVLPKSVPTTKYCPECGNMKRDITLLERM